MDRSELHFTYPDDLVATERQYPSRVMRVDSHGEAMEMTWQGFLNEFGPEDLLVINNTKVIKARVFTESGIEILFIENLDKYRWRVLCPARKWKKNKIEKLPDGVEARLLTSSIPQTVELNRNIKLDYFKNHGELPLPPYIQKVRGERHQRGTDDKEYQSIFADKMGSLAAPTASLHFQDKDVEFLKDRGVQIAELTLHVGLGTFLPVTADNLTDHKMHSEFISIPPSTIEAIEKTKSINGRVWALGTTVTRSLESFGQGMLKKNSTDGSYVGSSDLFITPGYKFKVIDGLLTNFHQPHSTLLALVYAFAGKDITLKTYQQAIEKNFRLFSYGDLCAFEKP